MSSGPSKDVQWWREEKPHDTVSGVVSKLTRGGYTRRDMNIHHLRLYADRDLYGAVGAYGLGGGTLSPTARAMQVMHNSRRPRLSINVIRNMCNAATSMLTRSRPKPTFTTNGGDWPTWQRARKQSQFIEAVYNAEDTHSKAAKMAQHGCILGTGAIKIVRDYANKKPRHEHTYIGELLLDETEAVYGMPRSLFQVRAVDKLVLKETYAGEEGAEEAIDKAEVVAGPVQRGEVSDCAIVIEGWHLPSGPDAEDGRYIVCTDSGTLYQADYKHQAFPFVTWRWEEDPLGFYGTGIPSELMGIQYEINETIRNIQANWWSGGNLKILVERGSKVQKAHLSNDLRGIIVEYTGPTPPQWITTNAVAPGLVEYLQFLIEQSYNITGISQLSAQSQTPFASMSGKARLVHENSESLRFLPAQRRLEQAIGVELGYRTLEACEDIYDAEGDFEVLYPDRKFLRPMMYSEVRAEPGTYNIQCYPTSILPSTPAGRFTMLEAWQAQGLISPDEMKRLADIPDLKREMDVDQAPVDFIDGELARIIDGEKVGTDGPVFPPEPDQPIDLVIKRTVNWIYWARTNHAPDEILAELRVYRDAALAIQKDQSSKAAAAAAAAAPPPMPPGMPPGMPPAGPMPAGPPLPQLLPGVAA